MSDMPETFRPVRFAFPQVTGTTLAPREPQSRPLAPTSPPLAPKWTFALVSLAPDLAPTSPRGMSRPLAPAFIEGGAR